MKVIKPITFSSATHLVSSSATESTSAWSTGATYALGANVHHAERLYQSLQAGNVGHTPASSPTWWVDLGPDNIHAMFDDQVSTATVASSSLTVELSPGYVNSLALLGLVGNELTVTVTDGDGGPVVYERTASLDGTFIFDWYMYFFEPYVQIGEWVATDIPPYSSAFITIALTSGGGNVQVGNCSLGTFYSIGSLEYGAQVGIVDYSKKVTDEFGTTSFVKRANAKTASYPLMLDKAEVAKVYRIIADLCATPAVWIGVDDDADYSVLTVFGFLKDFRETISYPTKSMCTLEIEGLI